MFEWIRHTDNTLNARLKDNVYADDVPAEVEVGHRRCFSKDDDFCLNR